jgi:mediator of RNA polymerase II transcription subunit 17
VLAKWNGWMDANQSQSLKLGQIIPRIIGERGSFANITEASLLEEIESSSRDDEDQEMDVEEAPETTESDEKDRKPAEVPLDQKAFEQARADLVQLIRQAQNESALSLDFVSLLLSCLRPAAGTTSMSPHLKQHVPVGALSADSLWVSIPEQDPLVGAGWKVESLSRASQQLQRASVRLKGEVEKEGKYWNSVMDIVMGGEVLFKIRKGDARALGIKYGYGDSGSEYRDKGLAIVKRRPDGGMSFKFDTSKAPKVLRVVLYNVTNGDRVKVGSSSPAILVPKDTVHNEIKNARTLLFEEELFFEVRNSCECLFFGLLWVWTNISRW